MHLDLVARARLRTGGAGSVAATEVEGVRSFQVQPLVPPRAITYRAELLTPHYSEGPICHFPRPDLNRIISPFSSILILANIISEASDRARELRVYPWAFARCALQSSLTIKASQCYSCHPAA